MRTLSLYVALALSAVSLGCDSSFRVDGPFVTVFSDLEGAEVARAELSFQPSASAESVGGSYAFVSGQLAEGLGSSGGLRVTGAGPDVRVELLPSVADGGVQLAGRIDGDLFTGTWAEGTIAGPRERGTFRGERRD